MVAAEPEGAVLEETAIVTDPAETAKLAGLRYINDTRPGFRRKRVGKHFSYIGLDGKPIHDKRQLERIKSLAIPPAWTDVWISPVASGHIQATGRDARGRKQYRYHPKWREIRDETKYHRMILFGERLPVIRERVDADLRRHGLTRERILATVVQLLDETAIRIGNEEYARDNQSFGLTTLQTEHVDVSGSTLHFHFVGKSGKEHQIDVRDRRVARIVKQCEDLPGQELFQYLDEHAVRRSIDSQDVNEYLQEITGQDFTAKDFRTWHGTVTAAAALADLGPAENATGQKKSIKAAIERASELLGNTPTICRKSYVHPGVLTAYADGSLFRVFQEYCGYTPSKFDLDRDETAVLALLREQFAESDGVRAAG